MNTISHEVGVVIGRRRRRIHSDEFKAQVVAACKPEGVSIAAVAMSNGINPNLARRWVVAAEGRSGNQSAALASAVAQLHSCRFGCRPLRLRRQTSASNCAAASPQSV